MTTESDPFSLSAEDEAAFAALQNDATPAPEPEVEEQEVSPEPEAEAEAEPEAKKPKTVPHQALHAEREEHKKTRAELQRIAQERAADMARFEERFRILQQQAQPQAQQPANEIPGEDDPMGRINWTAERLQQWEKQQAEEKQARTQAEAQQAQVNAVVNWAAAEWDNFVAERPEAADAYEHWRASRAREYARVGWKGPALEQAISKEMIQHAFTARQLGMSPPEYLVGLAEDRGWSPKPAAVEPDPEPAEKLERASKAQARGKSLSQAGGTAAPTEMTVQQLLSMSDDDFHTWTTKNPAKAKKLLGA